MCRHLILTLCLFNFKLVYSEIVKSSLTFVIDDTASMGDDIEEVLKGANKIFDTVINSNSSQIENFVLVTFNDPNFKVRTVTKKRDEFKSILSAVRVHGGGDCPEYAMSGIEKGLEVSRPRSYIYVFTDASAADYEIHERVTSLAQKTGSQVIFVLTGICDTEDSEDYLVYHKLAAATNGQVFHLEKGEINKILNYTVLTITGRRTVLVREEILPGGVKVIKFDIDTAMTDAIISSSGFDSKIYSISGPNGTKPHVDDIMKTDGIVIVQIKNLVPGLYQATVTAGSKTTVMVTASSTIDFEHGFSKFLPSSLNETATRPTPDGEHYLSIKLIDDGGNIRLKSISILDTDDNEIETKVLITMNKKEKFYVSELMHIPKTMFKIMISGYDRKSGSPVKRTASTFIKIQDPSLEKEKDKSPTVTITGDSKLTKKYDEVLTIKCMVSGYPQPDIIWDDKETGLPQSAKITVKEYPYDFISVLNVEKINKSTVYECKARNSQGSDSKSIQVDIKPEHVVIDKSKSVITAQRGLNAEIYCRIVRAFPYPKITWSFRSDLRSDFVNLPNEGEVLSLDNVTLDNEGTYRCLAQNEVNKATHNTRLIVLYPPSIKKDVEFVRSSEGKPFTLNCVADGFPKPVVSWYKGDNLIKSGVNFTIISDHILRFTSNLDNVGQYRCMAKNDLGIAARSVTVDVYVPVTVESPKTSSISIKLDKPLILPCYADGYPKPSYKWMFFSPGPEKDPETIKEGDNILSILKMQANQSGYYTCVAYNEYSSTKISYHVDVLTPPAINSTGVPKIHKGVKGDIALRIPCKTSGFPKPTVTWLKDELPIPADSPWFDIEEDTLILKDLDEKSRGIYVCHAENSEGVAEDKHEVYINLSPDAKAPETTVVLEEGGTANIYCIIPHGITDTLRWFKNEEEIARGELTLKNVTSDDTSVYICHVSTMIGSSSSTTKVIVQYKPKFLIPRDKETELIQLQDGITAYMECQAEANPTPKVRWWHNDEKIEIMDMDYIFDMNLRAAGKYRCTVSNELGTISRTFEVKPFDCYININTDLVERKPLIINPDLSSPKLPHLNKVGDYLSLPTGESLLMYCSSGFQNIPSSKMIIAECSEGQFIINSRPYNFADLKCLREMSPVAIKTGIPCFYGNTELIQVGYELGSGPPLAIYEVCLDKNRNRPHYVKYDLRDPIADSDLVTPRKLYHGKEIPFNFDELYDCGKQSRDISMTLGKRFHDSDSCCFDKRQLLDRRNVLPGLPQVATNSYLNLVPQWSTCNSQNWEDVENKMRNAAKSVSYSLTTWTGIYGYLRMPDSSKIIGLKDGKRRHLIVPEYIWKVVQDPVQQASLAIISVNVPDVALKQSHRYILCTDICKDIGWMKSIYWREVSRGLTYCCDLTSFQKTFRYDTYPIFNSDYSKILYNFTKYDYSATS